MTPHIIFKSAWEVSQRSDFKGGQKFKMFCGPRFAFDTFCDRWVVPFSISWGVHDSSGGTHGGSDCPLSSTMSCLKDVWWSVK